MFSLRAIRREILLLFPLALVFSCSSHHLKDKILFSVLNESLENDKKSISYQSEITFSLINDRLLDPEARQKAKLWQPKALAAQEYTKKVDSYLEKLKQSLIQRLQIQETKNTKDVNDDEGAVNQFFEKEGKGKILYESLNEFKKNILNIDNGIDLYFRNEFSFLPSSVKVEDKPDGFTFFFFHNTSPKAAIAILTHLQNTAILMGNKVLAYISDHTSVTRESYETFSVIIGQSAHYVKAGDSIEITAGIGAFSRAAKPLITMNGKVVPIGDQACSISKVKTSMLSGRHTIPVKIQYTDQDGKQQIVEKDVEYAVINY